MPFTPKQMKAIRARAHGWDPGGDAPFANVSVEKAKQMQSEGIRPPKRKRKHTAREAAEALAGRRNR